MDRSTLRVAFRTLGRHKGFTTVAILSIAIAIALNTVMYSVLDAVIAPRINARQPDHIYSLWFYGNGLWVRNVHPRVYEDALRDGMGQNVESFTGVQQFTFRPAFSGAPIVEFGDRYKRVSPVTVSPNYFDFLGAAPIQGRTFRESDEKEGAQVAVISDRLARHLSPDATLVGQTIEIDGGGFVVIGVVERSALFDPLKGDFWTLRQSNAPHIRPTMIRLKEIVPDHLLKDQLAVAGTRMAQAMNEKGQWVAFQGKQIFKGQITIPKFYLALVGSVAAILLVACANLANLQLARGLARTRELALRAAVGASRAQLIRLLLLESGILAVVGLSLGVVLTLWGMKLVDSSMPEVVANLILKPQTSWRVFAFAAGAAVACLFIVGLVPALTVSKVDPNEMLKAGAGTGANKEHRKRYGLMVVAQFGFALPVLISAIVLLRNAWEIGKPEYIYRMYGYDGRQILSGSVPYAAPPGQQRVVRTLTAATDIMDRARATTGVLDAAVFTWGMPDRNAVTVDGADGQIREEMAHQWSYRKVTPNYLTTLGMRISRGRDFAEGEADGTAVILDAASAAFLWKGENPIGRAIKFGKADSKVPWLRVVGIVRDPRDIRDVSALDYTTGFRMAGAYRPITPQDSFTVVGQNRWITTLALVAKARGSTELAAVRLQRNLRAIAGTNTPSAIPQTEEMGLGNRIVMQNFIGSLFGVFAIIGLGLVAMGVYGIVAHSVAERKRELAVRIAIGAAPKHIYHAVLREGNVLLLAGLALGLLIAKFMVQWVGMYSWGWDVFSAPLYAGVGLFLFAVAVASAYVPALRATRIDPVEALRHE